MTVRARSRSLPLVAAAVLFLAVTALGLWVVRPFATAPIGPDAAAPVIEFKRLLAGQRLEGYLSQTSKPLLTFVYGVAQAVTGDWRWVSLLAIVSFSTFVVCAAWLAYRLDGPIAAGFAAAGLALFPGLLLDVLFAYGVSWAMLACSVAGLAVTARRPRYGLAGVALWLGGLARPEVLAITAVALVVLAGAHLVARSTRAPAPPAAAWLVALGLLAVPSLSVHDWALTGDPWMWLTTALANSAGNTHVRSPLGVIGFVGGHELLLAPLLPLAAVALLAAAIRRRWLAAVVIGIVPFAVGVFFVASGARGTVVSARYLIPIDVGIVWAAGVGLGAVSVPWLRRWVRRTWPVAMQRHSAFVAVALGFAVALAMVPSWPLARGVRAAAADQRQRAANASKAFSAMAGSLDPKPAWRGVAAPRDTQPRALIPPAVRAQGIVDLDLPLWAGAKLSSGMIDPEDGRPTPGTILYHDRLGGRSPVWRSIEVDRPTVIGRLRLVPIYVDADDGVWVLRVEAAPGGATEGDGPGVGDPPVAVPSQIAGTVSPSHLAP